MSRRLVIRKIKLEKISSSTPDAEREERGVGKKAHTGVMVLGPSIGRSFTFYRDDAEYMHTSTVKTIEYVAADKLILHTLNSVYELTIGEELNQ